MKQKIIDFISFVCCFTSLIYISGQYGAMECDTITIRQFIIRTGIGTIILALGVVLSNLQNKKSQ
jgi:hypothetical protein